MSPSRPQFQISLPKPNRLSLLKIKLTMSILEEKYPSESRVREYTDGSATNTNERRGWYMHSVS